MGSSGALGLTQDKDKFEKVKALIRPKRLQPGDWVGLITPASPPFESSVIYEGKVVLESLGFRVKLGKNLGKKHGYLAGTDKARADDLHEMFLDKEVRAMIALRGGYGTGRLIEYLDFKLIEQHPKIIVGYSDISLLNLAIHQMTGLVTFHGPVAISSFNKYTTHYFMKVLTESSPVGEIEKPPMSELQKFDGIFPIREGIASGPLIGGNLTMIIATLGTPFEINTVGKILFIEEVGEEPYDLDRMLTHLRLAGKFDRVAGIILDKCGRCGPAEYKPAFENSLSIEEVFYDRLQDLNCPVLYGLSLGHAAYKPTLPLGISATMNTQSGQIRIDDAAVD
ncbi:LD-carboxypeptidase [candidate division KSB1 bacterium]|nr:LD-carboxypeptidase [candidate division KSB1 bacterium]